MRKTRRKIRVEVRSCSLQLPKCNCSSDTKRCLAEQAAVSSFERNPDWPVLFSLLHGVV